MRWFAAEIVEAIRLTEKELKKLNRYQLLELLIVQTERADSLQAKLDAQEQKQTDQELRLLSLGSIAEASLQVSGVFAAAQEAADRYLEAAKKRAEEIEAAAYQKASAILAQAQARRITGE